MNGSLERDVQDFQRDVIDRSFTLPVVVDFWAEWCGPCKVLGPVLERLADPQQDRWALAKVDTEKFTEESLRYGIQSIPNVKMFFEGKVIGEFIGALPEYAVAQWLKQHLPAKSKNQMDTAKLLIGEGRQEDAKTLLENILREEPDNAEATLLLARLVVLTDYSYSARLIKNIDDPRLSYQREMIDAFIHMAEVKNHPGNLPDGPVKPPYLHAIEAALRNDFREALAGFIEIIRNDRYFDDDGSRKACIAIFRYLGDDHPLTLEYRRDFNNALY